VRIIVGFAAGGGYDIIARLIGQWLSERLGQPFVIENRPGAATNIATQVVVNAAPDGYTLLLIGPTNTINTTLYRNLHFDFIRDIAPVSSITRQPQVMLTNRSFPAKTIPELIDYAKANPDKVNTSSPGVGSISHLALELFKMMAGVKLVHVPFGGNAPALTALLGGQVEVSVASLPSSIESIRTGKLHGLAVTTAMRAEALPDVPAVGEFVSGYEVSAWYGMGAPTGTPPEAIDKINKEINAGLADTKLKARIADFGGTPFALSPAKFGKFIAEECYGAASSERLQPLIEPFAPDRVDCAAYTLAIGPEVYVSPNETADPTTVSVRRLDSGEAFTIRPVNSRFF
jgi:tripartite-type tricarboxylate transporter receptor subunit TctC